MTSSNNICFENQYLKETSDPIVAASKVDEDFILYMLGTILC
jgi:hypothetical protein